METRKYSMKKDLIFLWRFFFSKNGFCNMSQMINRPPIKNNLNEQLKIYYAYRDENIQNRLNNNNTENQSLSQ
jgi:hypothetical protein